MLVLRRKSWVTAMPIEAKAREVRSQARKVRSARQTVSKRQNPEGIEESSRVIYLERGGPWRRCPCCRVPRFHTFPGILSTTANPYYLYPLDSRFYPECCSAAAVVGDSMRYPFRQCDFPLLTPRFQDPAADLDAILQYYNSVLFPFRRPQLG